MPRLLLALLLLLIPHVCVCQDLYRCEQWNGKPERCASVIDNAYRNSTVFVPYPTYTQDALAATVEGYLSQIDTPLTPPECRESMVKFICLSAFKGCTPLPNPTFVTAVLPTFLIGLKEKVEDKLKITVRAGASLQFIAGALAGTGQTPPTSWDILFNNPGFSYGVSGVLGQGNSLNFSTTAMQSLLLRDSNGTDPFYGWLAGASHATGMTAFYLLSEKYLNGSLDSTSLGYALSLYSVTEPQFHLACLYVNQFLMNITASSLAGGEVGISEKAQGLFYQQWGNASVDPRGFDLNQDGNVPDGFEIGSFDITTRTFRPSNISLEKVVDIWNSSLPYAITNQAGIFLWQNTNPLAPPTTPAELAQLIGLETSEQASLIITWLTRLSTSGLFLAETGLGSLNTALPAAPCAPLCSEISRNCAQFALQNPLSFTLQNCTGLDSDTGLPAFPETYSYFDVGNNIVVPVPCTPTNTIKVDVTVTPEEIDCGDLAFRAGAYPPCAEPCYTPVFSSDKWATVIKLTEILSWFSWLLTLPLIVTFILRKKGLKFPKNMHLFLVIGSNFLAFGVIIGNLHGVKETLCIDDFTRADFSHAICGAQGFFVLYGALIASFWWLMIISYLFVTIILKVSSFWKQRVAKIFYCVGFGVPTILTIIALAARKIGFVNGQPWCFLVEDDNHAWELALFFVPVSIVLVVGAVFLIFVIIEFTKSSLRMRGHVQGGKKEKRLPPETFRLLMFLAILFYTLIFVFAYRYDIMNRETDIEKAFRDHSVCLLKRQYGLVPEDDPCTFEDPPSYPIWVLFCFNVSIQGILLFIFFGATKQNYNYWRRVLKEKRFSISQTNRSEESASASERKSGKESSNKLDNSASNVELSNVTKSSADSDSK